MRKNKLAAPVVKWAGGKRQLLGDLVPLLPARISPYCEPFVGGGALFFRLQPSRASINDINSELIGIYQVIRNDLEELIASLETHRNEPEYYYNIRSLDRDKAAYQALSPVERASRLLYLNKTCYNGLYRVNHANEFNVPFGRYKNPNIVNAPVLRAVSSYLNKAQIRFSSLDFADALADVNRGTFVYLDPPYDPVSDTASFTGYSSGGFGRQEQIRLRECCDALSRRGIRFMLSNSATGFIKEQYAAYHITTVRARRSVNSVSSGRGPIDEVIIRNYT